MADPGHPRVTLRLKDRGAGPVIYARFRLDDKNAEPGLGRGWLAPEGSGEAKRNGRTLAEAFA